MGPLEYKIPQQPVKNHAQGDDCRYACFLLQRCYRRG